MAAIDITTIAVRLTARDFLSPKLRGLARRFPALNRKARFAFSEMANTLEAGGARGSAAAIGLGLALRNLSMMYDRVAFAMFRFMKQTVKAAADFESTMVRFSVITGVVDKDLRNLEDAILAFTGPLPTSANEVAKAATAFAKMGFMSRVGAKGLVELSMEAIKFGRAIGVADEQAALYLGKLATWLNIQDPTAEKMKEVASMVTRLGWTIKGTAQDVIKATERFGAFVRALGATEAQTLALAALVQDSGILIRRGSTAINRTFQLMSINAGRFGRAMATAGVVESAEQFERLFQTSPVMAFRTVLMALNKEGGAYGATLLKSLGLHGNYISDLITMSRNVRGFQRNLDATHESLENTRKGMAATDKAYEAAMQTWEQARRTLYGAVENIMIIIGREFLPVLVAVAKAVSNFLAWLIKVSPTTVKIIGWILGIISVLLILGVVIKGIAFALAGLAIIGTATFALFLLKLLLVLAAVAAIAALIIFVGNKLGLWEISLDDIAEKLKEVGKESQKAVTPRGLLGGGEKAMFGRGEGGMPKLAATETAGIALPGMQAGGIALSPTPVMVAEKEPEGVLPLSVFSDMLTGFAERVAASVGGGGGSVSVSTPIYLDGRQLAESRNEQIELDGLRTGELI